MAVFTDPIDFVSIWGTDGIGLLVGIRDNTTDSAGRQNCANRAYLELAGLKGYWRKRVATLTLTAGTVAYNAPAGYDSPFRLYYRQTGRMRDVEFLSDALWLERSATRAADAGTPHWARTVQTAAATVQIEVTPPPSSSFITTTSSTLTLEYFLTITLLSGNTDVPILPPNLRPHVIPLGAYYYALAQGDFELADRLFKEAELARAAVLKHDVTRTGRPRQLRPRPSGVLTGRGRFDYGDGV